MRSWKILPLILLLLALITLPACSVSVDMGEPILPPTDAAGPAATPEPTEPPAPTPSPEPTTEPTALPEPTEAPTAVPPVADTVFEAVSHTAFVEGDSISIVGEVVNRSAETVSNMVIVEATLYDADGNALEGDFSTYLDRPSIEPGEKSSFWVYVTADDFTSGSIDDVAEYELYFTLTDSPSPDVELTVIQPEFLQGGASGKSIVGVVHNQTDMTFAVIVVYSTLYDANGNVINVTMDPIELDEPLGPGESTDFYGYFVSHYEGSESFAVYVTGYVAEDVGMTTPTAEAATPQAVERPTPTGVPAPEETRLKFLTHTGWYEEDGSLKIIGEVENASADTIRELVLIEATLKDSVGNIIPGEFRGYLQAPVLEPGKVSPFVIIVRPEQLGVAEPTDYELLATRTVVGSPDVELEIYDLDGGPQGSSYIVNGMARNDTDQTFVILSVYAAIYDASGQLLDVTFDMFPMDPSLGPGMQAGWNAEFTNVSGTVEAVRVFVTGWTLATWQADKTVVCGKLPFPGNCAR